MTSILGEQLLALQVPLYLFQLFFSESGAERSTRCDPLGVYGWASGGTRPWRRSGPSCRSGGPRPVFRLKSLQGLLVEFVEPPSEMGRSSSSRIKGDIFPGGVGEE